MEIVDLHLGSSELRRRLRSGALSVQHHYLRSSAVTRTFAIENVPGPVEVVVRVGDHRAEAAFRHLVSDFEEPGARLVVLVRFREVFDLKQDIRLRVKTSY